MRVGPFVAAGRKAHRGWSALPVSTVTRAPSAAPTRRALRSPHGFHAAPDAAADPDPDPDDPDPDDAEEPKESDDPEEPAPQEAPRAEEPEQRQPATATTTATGGSPAEAVHGDARIDDVIESLSAALGAAIQQNPAQQPEKPEDPGAVFERWTVRPRRTQNQG